MNDGLVADVHRPQKALPNWRRKSDSREDARARMLGKLRMLIP
jgi:hypothetical protein